MFINQVVRIVCSDIYLVVYPLLYTLWEESHPPATPPQEYTQFVLKRVDANCTESGRYHTACTAPGMDAVAVRVYEHGGYCFAGCTKMEKYAAIAGSRGGIWTRDLSSYIVQLIFRLTIDNIIYYKVFKDVVFLS